MKVTIDNALLQAKIDAMQINHTEATSTHANTREEELQAKRQLIDDELNAISNKTWKAPFEDNNTRNLLSRPPIPQEKKKVRFEPKMPPKFNPEDDLEQWLTEVQLDVESFGEELLCPLIWKYCFPQDSSVRTWYSLLGGRTQAMMTTNSHFTLRGRLFSERHSLFSLLC